MILHYSGRSVKLKNPENLKFLVKFIKMSIFEKLLKIHKFFKSGEIRLF